MLAEMQLNRLVPEASARTAQQAFDLARELGDEPAAARAVLRWHRGLCMAGRAGQGEAVWQAQQGWMAAVPWASAECVSDRGWVLDRLGRPREARAWHQRALDMTRAAGQPFDEAVVLGNLAQSLLLRGEPAAAIPVLDRADALSTRGQGLHGPATTWPCTAAWRPRHGATSRRHSSTSTWRWLPPPSSRARRAMPCSPTAPCCGPRWASAAAR